MSSPRCKKEIKRESVSDAPFSIAPGLESYQLNSLQLGLEGEYQHINASLAVALCIAFEKKLQSSAHRAMLDEGRLPEKYLNGLATTSWSGRSQVLHCNIVNKDITDCDRDIGTLDFYLDGAHTAESLAACANWWYSSVTARGNVMASSNGHANGISSRTDIKEVRQRQKVLLFNCMPKRNPRSLLESFLKTCKKNGVGISMAMFVPPFSSHVSIDTRDVADIYTTFLEGEPNLSWQMVLQQTWESIQMEYNEVTMLEPSSAYVRLKEGVEQGKFGREYKHCIFGSSSVVMPSLPAALNWLRNWASENPTELQVLVTGSLYLVGDVLRIHKDYRGLELEIKANATVWAETQTA